MGVKIEALLRKALPARENRVGKELCNRRSGQLRRIERILPMSQDFSPRGHGDHGDRIGPRPSLLPIHSGP